MIKLVLSQVKCLPWPPSFSLEAVQIHRGYIGDGAKENTLDAFRSAAKLGAKMVELDVRLDQSGNPIILHDPDPGQMMTAPTLDELFKATDIKLKLNIELKSEVKGDALARRVSELVKLHSMQSRIMFSSFNPVTLWQVSKYLPEIPRALLVSSSQEVAWYLRYMAFAPFLKIHMLNLQDEMITEEFARFLMAHNIPYAVWTVNDPIRAQQLLDWGAASIISDKMHAVTFCNSAV